MENDYHYMSQFDEESGDEESGLDSGISGMAARYRSDSIQHCSCLLSNATEGIIYTPLTWVPMEAEKLNLISLVSTECPIHSKVFHPPRA